MTWLTANWQLKVLALGLSVGMFAAVAFAQNPIIVRTINAPVSYDNLSPDVMLVSPPSQVRVNLSGLRETVATVSAASVLTHVDVSRVKPGNAVVVAIPKILSPGITSNDRININLVVDVRKAGQPVPIELRDYRLAAGWVESSKPVVSPAAVRVTGPAAFFTNDLHAFVSLGDSPVSGDSNIPNLAIQFQSGGKTVSLPSTIPFSTEEVAVASVELHSRRPNVVRQVTLTVDVSGTPAPGYQVTRVSFDTLFITVTGPADSLSALDTIDIGRIAIDGLTADRTFRNMAVPLPSGVTIVPPSPRAVSITVGINRVVPPTPTPTPTNPP